MVLYHDEVIYTHQYVQTHSEGIKGYGKKVNDVKECSNNMLLHSAAPLKKLVLIFSVQRGHLGYKALFIFMGLSRDEIYRLLRHNHGCIIFRMRGQSVREL